MSCRTLEVSLLLLLVATCTTYVHGIAVHVRFDGSLRPPSDHGLPTSSLARMAACAASISIHSDPVVATALTTDKRAPVQNCYRYCYLGGKLLVASSTTTSAEVEYEGLLFALQGCNSFLQTHATELQLSDANIVIDVVVQGDCKTLMDQMRGISQPRKLEEYHQKAILLLSTIHNAAATSRCQFHFDFQHIPRGENILCDRLSARLLVERQMHVHRRLWHDLRNLSRQVRATIYHATTTTSTLENSGNGAAAQSQTTYQIQLQRILDQYLTTGRSCVPLSARPVLYRTMARIAASLNDYSILLTLGHMYQRDVDAVLRSRPKVTTITGSTTSTINPSKVQLSSVQETTLMRNVEPIDEKHMVQATTIQMFALEKLRRPKDAKILERKFRWLLERFRLETQQIRADLTSFTLHDDEVDHFSDDWTTCMDVPDREESGWPPVVNQWWENAVVSNSWNETHIFWKRSNSSAIV